MRPSRAPSPGRTGHGLLVVGGRHRPDGRLGEDPEPTLRAEDELAQVGPGRRGRVGRQVERSGRRLEPAAGEQRLDPAEPERALARRAGDDPAAERRVLPGLRLVAEQPAPRPERRLEGRTGDPGAERRQTARLVEGEQPGQPLEVDRRGSADRRPGTVRARSATARRRRSCRRRTGRRSPPPPPRSRGARGPRHPTTAGRPRRAPDRAGRCAGRSSRRGSGRGRAGPGPRGRPRASGCAGDGPADGRDDVGEEGVRRRSTRADETLELGDGRPRDGRRDRRRRPSRSSVASSRPWCPIGPARGGGGVDCRPWPLRLLRHCGNVFSEQGWPRRDLRDYLREGSGRGRPGSWSTRSGRRASRRRPSSTSAAGSARSSSSSWPPGRRGPSRSTPHRPSWRSPVARPSGAASAIGSSTARATS